MKLAKKLVVLVFALAIALSAAACSAAPTFSVNGKQDTSYAVTSQGGMAVQYGNYVYFVNGYRGYADDDGKQNTNVQKGGIYRAELNGNSYTQTIDGKTVKLFASQTLASELDFFSTKGLDYDEQEIDVVNVQQIAAKTVGTSGYNSGGMFIFGSYVYYATPSNELDRKGNRQVDNVELYRSRLDGSFTERIYKTENVASSAPYSFYYFKGFVYMVILDGTDLISVKMSNDRIYRAQKIAEDVTSAILPYQSMYFGGIDNNRAEDFVFFTRDVVEADRLVGGNVVEMMRPDGSCRNKIIANGLSVTLEAVRDGLLFYRHTVMTSEDIMYTDLASVIRPNEYSAGNFVGGTVIARVSDYSSYYLFRPNINSNVANALVIINNNILFFDGYNFVTVYEGVSPQILLVDNSFVYFLEDSKIFRTEYVSAASSKTNKSEQITEDAVNSVGFNIEICASHIVYIAQVDEWANDYTFFKKVNLNPNNKATFVGERIEEDVKPEDEDEEA